MSDNDDDPSLEELKSQTTKGKRTGAAAQEQQGDLSEDIIERLAAIEDGDRKTLAIRDESLSALFGALEERPEEMEAVIDELSEAAGKDVSDPSKSDLTRLAVRVGLQTAVPEVWDELLDAKRERAVEQA